MKPKAFLSLVRIPTVFSSMSNAYAGFLIAGGRPGMPLLLGILAAGLFIMAGMALNDIADSAVDARERPTRPIPSGAVRPGEAWGLSLGMMALGLVLLWAANPPAAAVGAALCAAIFAYNFLLKGTFLGPAAMGLCRLLNLLAGMALTWGSWEDAASLSRTAWLALISLWAYIALVTFLARNEVQGNSRKRSLLYLGGMALWLIAWLAAGFVWLKPQPPLAVAWVALVLLLRDPWRRLAEDPSPKHTGQAVGAMLRLVPLVDVMAMLANGVDLPWALAGVLWIAPAYAVGKLFYST